MNSQNLIPFDINTMKGFSIGNAEDAVHGTGCTVILCDDAYVCGQTISGGAPASRESALLRPTAVNNGIYAIVLSGGSAFGLASADGVMQYLEEHHIGFPTDYGIVPIVCASCLFDLGVGDSSVRPDAEMGKAACHNAKSHSFVEGNHGAGTGASIGKLLGFEHSMKAGIGAYAVRCGSLEVACIVAVNALGDVIDHSNNTILAGLQDPSTGTKLNSMETLFHLSSVNAFQHTNTTLGVVLTNAALTKSQLTKVAEMADDGFARSIQPSHTTFDGDTVYAISTSEVDADMNVVGALASEVMAIAIERAVQTADSAYGLPGLHSTK